MGLSVSGINEENHIVNRSWIAWLIADSIGAILSVPFCPLPFCPRTPWNPYTSLTQSILSKYHYCTMLYYEYIKIHAYAHMAETHYTVHI